MKKIQSAILSESLYNSTQLNLNGRVMKRFFLAISILHAALFAQVHYAKLEPVETYQIKSAVSGKVVFADLSKEGRIGTSAPVVRIDDIVDKEQKRALATTLEVLEETLALTEEMIENQERVYERDEAYYMRIKDLKTKSKTEKDRVFAAMAASRNQLLSLKEKRATLKRQIADTKYQLLQLQDRIEKKSVSAEGLYIYRVAVRMDDYVNPGTLLLTAMDTKKGKLTLFLDADEVENMDSKRIYLDGKVTDLKFSKVIKVADTVHISSYRAEIVIDSPKGLFSRLVKVELK